MSSKKRNVYNLFTILQIQLNYLINSRTYVKISLYDHHHHGRKAFMKCSYCGNLLKDHAQFCSNCGRSVENPSSEPLKQNNAEKGAYAISILLLIIVLALTVFGGFVIIYRDLHAETTVSASDEKTHTFNYELVSTDTALVGKWICTDRAAADYSDSNYGVDVNAVLHLTGDGKFTLDYAMSNTGIPAMQLSTSGKYSTQDGIITFIPDNGTGATEYLKRHGKQPSFQYSTDENSFTLKYENGKDILFSRISE